MHEVRPGGPEGGPPTPSEQSTAYTDPQQRMWAMWCHLSALAGLLVPLGSILGPLIVWLTKRQEYPSVDAEGKKALNFQITTLIAYVVFVVVLIAAAASEIFVLAVLIGLALLALGIAWIIWVILASVRTNEGKDFRYPLSIRFLK